MSKLVLIILAVACLGIPAKGLELTAPTVPESAEEFMVSDPQNLKEGIVEIIKEAVGHLRPDLKEASTVCIGIIGSVMIISMLRSIPGGMERTADMVATVAVSGIFLSAAGALMDLGTETVTQVSEYGKLLLPVMTAALAAQGGITTSSALYAGTALFDAVLSSLISKVLMPMLYVFLALAVANSAIGDDLLKKLRDSVKWLMTWVLKIILYVFTGFISITGVVSGPTDAAALKAAKLTISGVVPVVGGILSDASEAVLVSAGMVKNSVGLYGLFAVLAIWIGPFFRIGTHYLLLRFTGGVCSIFASKRSSDLIQDFATVMGFLLAMTGSVCLMLLISTVCFMRGVG